MSRRTVIVASLVLLFLLGGCKGKGSAAEILDPYIPDEASVPFDLEPITGSVGQQCWLATYTADGKTAKFRIELGPAEALAADPNNKAASEFKFGKGRLVPQPGSEPAALLAALQKTLEAKAPPKPVKHKSALPFEYVNLGAHLAQLPGGGFGEKSNGHWTAMKLFLGKGEQESEVFLNLNPKLRKGQFSIKDPEYGDLVLAELAKVL
ncbi:hypothetical protein [Paludibaculum fermentans]|uniref:Lipoprotein n=1 Tax=Paludibaculum fermentans TaxID=1473598 RepID=A0A7S7NVT6_PALFE|nr:hypothetical protein [Paludibaculum fermentans]QOY90658.1 hypothetical protein IRI77_12125 [Paludibaculum fermentans]